MTTSRPPTSTSTEYDDDPRREINSKITSRQEHKQSPNDPSPLPSPPSLFAICLLYLSLIGLGIILGYLIFHRLLVTRCTSLLYETEVRHNRSLAELRTQHNASLGRSAGGECRNPAAATTQDDENNNDKDPEVIKLRAELDETRGRLEAQTTLVERHTTRLVQLANTERTLTECQNQLELRHNNNKKCDEKDEEMQILRNKVTKLQILLDQQVQQEQSQNQQQQEELKHKVKEMESNYAKQITDLTAISNERLSVISSLQKNVHKLETREKRYKENVDRMKDGVARLSRQFVREKYGEGPHRVELILNFHDDNDTNQKNQNEEKGDSNVPFESNKTTQKSLVIELAPIQLMPHAVHTYLDMVSRGLYDGIAFHIGNAHIVLAGPVHANPSQTVKLRQQFQQVGYYPSSLVYQEYNNQYPHKAYTIGFAGKPLGGPNFYISLVDTSGAHGPSLTGQLDEYGWPIQEGEPCFGMVVDGFETLERLRARPRMEGENSFKFVEMVTIESAKVIT